MRAPAKACRPVCAAPRPRPAASQRSSCRCGSSRAGCCAGSRRAAVQMGDPVAKRTLHELVAAAATRAPDAVAITTGTQSVTYRDLMCRAEHLAGRLVQAGAGPGVYVGVIADRRIQTVVSFLGVLLSGAAYV